MLNFNKLLEASLNTLVPLLFLSDRGIGKTAQVKAYCESINHLLITIILGRIPSVDIGGIRVPNFETGELQLMISRTLLGDVPNAEKYDGICVFFDEISATTEDQQTSIQTIVEERELEGHQVPDNVWFVFAGNPPDSNCGSNDIVRSLLDRCVVIEISEDDIQEEVFPNWLEWAEGEGDLYPLIPAFLRWARSSGSRNFFHDSDPKSPDLAQVSARAWTKFSAFLYQQLDSGTLDRIGRGLLGRAVYTEFNGWRKLGGGLPTVDEILSDPLGAIVPEGNLSVSGLFAVVSNVVAELRHRQGQRLPTEVVDAVITYFRRLPDAFAVFGFKRSEHAHPDFANSSSEWAQFLKDHQDLVV